MESFMKKSLSILTLALGLSSVNAVANTAPVMFSTLNGFNAPAADTVTGLRVAVLHGKVNEVKGLDLAIVGLSETEKTTGINFGWFGATKVNQSMTGVSFGILNWMEGNTQGVNFGAVNLTNNVQGANLSFVNYSQGNTLVDLGAVSFSNASTVQVGLFNKTTHIKGVQIGLLNCADNGFLKCFPIINFAK
jgi:hypothetical protein